MPQTDLNISVTKATKSLETLNPIYAQGLENARYLRGDNWSKRDKERHIAQGFYQAFSIPLIATKINRILSLQRQNRVDAKCRGRGEEDELGAEVLNLVKRFTQDSADYKWLESDVFKDGLAKKYGVICIYPDYTSNPQGDIRYKVIPFHQFYWDTNSITYGIWEDGTFGGAYEWIPADKVSQLYPDFSFKDSNVEQNFTEANIKIADWYDPAQRLIKVCNHFDKNITQKYLVKNTLSDGEFEAFDNRKEAGQFITDMIAKGVQQLQDKPELNIKITEQDFVVIPQMMEEWDNVVFSGNNEIERKTHKYSVPPYQRYCSMFDEGEFWSLIDLAKDPQKAYDRYTSMMDKATVKNIKGNNYTYILSMMGAKYQNNPDKLFADASAGGKFFEVNNHNAIQGLEKYQNITAEAELAMGYASIIDDIFGSRTFQGLDTQTRQTATEVKQLERNALQSGNLYIDNLLRYKQNVARYEIELIKDVYTPDRTFRVLGEVMTKKVLEAMQSSGIYKESSLFKGEYGWIDLSKMAKPLYDCNVDTVIDDVASTPTDKQEKFNQLLAVNQVAMNSGYPPMPFEFLLQYSNLDATVKNGLIEYQQEANARLAQQQKMAEDSAKVDKLTEVIKATKPAPKPVMNGQSNGVLT